MRPLTGRVSKAASWALSHGARGYLEEEALRLFLATAVRLVEAGEAWVPRRMVAMLTERSSW